ncbi:MAG: glycosyltransferase family 4 protein, partial [Lachnospiraceae bacterium]|nr:glycosyltransferase family 4 protein [Lachnospiraceae bacterium]
MTIAIDLTAIYDHLSGIERYNINITRELIRQHPNEEYILFFKNEVHDSFRKEVDKPNVKYVILPECHKLFFIQWRLFKALQKTDADYYIFLCFSSPVLFKKGRIINAIHDLTFWDCPECIPVKMKYYYRMTAGISVKRSWRIIAVSRFSQKRVCEHYGLPLERVPVIYDGLTDIFKKAPVADPNLKFKYNLPERYVLSLSTIEPRKNLQLLIRAYKELAEEGKKLPDLVLAGREGWKLEDIVGDISEEVKNRIHFTGFIDDEDLPQIY